MKSGTDMHGSLRINPDDFDELMNQIKQKWTLSNNLCKPFDIPASISGTLCSVL